ncbi:MAG: hypothetical protein KUA35_16710 [Pseudodesulfovibrio sp.]|uniref:Uncharacterized protein n=1 Tax=Pseudodesulfovibrio aespoeensis (strain ATCC 700646 / DSM 10631 / Aspo-2) TaxID=643562 RepID=E6VVN1_PSEA9|nr:MULTISPECIES: hypothetical protein [Pseudodesulfovibrio]MBU4192536.1 hypothetical protein [Pseudomonadota bacterium]ADU63589.1 hypothetical protein Daes_2591 [Pseudodesulfovibrio aespoeensis Aspo-2]MBU4243555.1 hypothetical protein [Pseudomonadota bacterium]MBU4378502.1 hypothetical protein [Pseudomonadota bacterium]MBU4475302.1 hypothetical protein [Pseudomonadota bacterium]
MTKKKKKFATPQALGAVFVILLAMASVALFAPGLFMGEQTASDGLAGTVSVKGTVKLTALDLSKNEVMALNQAVQEHRNTFSQVDLFLDSKGGPDQMEGDTVLVWAMVLETNGECEIRSWSRKVARAELVPQVVLYMKKAAREYAEFRKFPDVTQNFKCLYI